MTRTARWASAALCVLIPLGIVLPAAAQRAGGKGDDLARAKEMAQLIEQGQLNLRDATALAEKHVKGVALTVSCEIQPGMAKPAEAPKPEKPGAQPKPGGPSAQAQQPDSGKHLIYEISCFADGRLQAVRVDALTRKVADVRERSTLAGIGSTLQ